MSKLFVKLYSNSAFGAVLRKIPAACYYSKGIVNVEIQEPYKYNSKALEPIESAYSRFKPSTERSSVPIIILHCLLGSRKQWEKLGRDIAERSGRMVYTLDARNHGRSGHSILSDFWSLSLDVEYFLASHGIPRCQVLGHSLGGRTAMFMALTKPELVEKLLVQDISPVSLPKKLVPFLAFVGTKLKELMDSLPEGLSLAQAQELAHEMFEPIAPFPLFRQMLVDLLDEQGGKIICNLNLEYVMNANLIDADMANFPQLDTQYHGPTQFLCAEKPQYVRYPGDYDAIQKYFPNAEIHRLKGADHLMHVEDPERYLDMAVDFFEDRPSI